MGKLLPNANPSDADQALTEAVAVGTALRVLKHRSTGNWMVLALLLQEVATSKAVPLDMAGRVVDASTDPLVDAIVAEFARRKSGAGAVWRQLQALLAARRNPTGG